MRAMTAGSVTVTGTSWRWQDAVSQAMNSGRSCHGATPGPLGLALSSAGAAAITRRPVAWAGYP
ncbi:hypothetical protein [Candidatus Mycobacterium methanotrophicum]|uniref:Uncharacterized protein n=1 Tax=Candidatus Mycobacterium methanotrophicum TaxID=2943498 RepID=A0ABY4QHV8_9MYCO|nr:hypothetical protein [Candidatus Mycobacterium methanotrophicum]UQX09540.1 hypothetical protein M5I08_14245 [Candidatus Mycobacterium methanotrophicum]